MHKYDFGGYATKNDLVCGDGRVIRRDAFKDSDGTTVPLVWQHVHDDPTNVLGHALLENRDDGVYAYCTFNNTDKGQSAKELVEHGDVTSLSIYANKLKQNGNNVVHGLIREVSLVLAGANPGATIDNLSFAHSDGSLVEDDEEAIIRNGHDNWLDLAHSDDDKKKDEPKVSDDQSDEDENGDSESQNNDEDDSGETVADVLDTLNDEQAAVVEYLVNQAKNGGKPPKEMAHSDDGEDDGGDGRTIGDVIDTLTEKQRKVVEFVIGEAMNSESDDSENGEVEHSDVKEGNMKKNVFDQTGEDNDDQILSHDDLNEIVADAKRVGSMKEAFIEHGVTDLDILFPEAKATSPTPEMITRPMGWVPLVWNATRKSPFSRIKSIAADLTADDARAKGYIKGKKKLEEQFGLLKRVTTPQTVYKKQKLDRDDIIDIVDIDVVAWLKQEMRMMLDEELARAILVGDGRSAVSEDKIKEDNVRPIYQDADMYTIHYTVNYAADATDDEKSATLVDAAIKSRKNYRGTGSPTFYASTDVITQMLLARDKIGRRLYRTQAELADALRVSNIVEVPVMENVTRTDDNSKQHELLGLIVNLADYTVGSDRGGEVKLFDDFDIDYNQQKYLIETRVSGALTHPYSAIALEVDKTANTPSSEG